MQYFPLCLHFLSLSSSSLVHRLCALPPLQEESLTYQSKLDTLEADILKCREDLCNITVIAQEAQISKEQARVSRTSSVTYKTPRMIAAVTSQGRFTQRCRRHL